MEKLRYKNEIYEMKPSSYEYHFMNWPKDPANTCKELKMEPKYVELYYKR